MPVAAYPVPGPLDVVGDSGAGVLDEDLGLAVERTLAIDREIPRSHALNFTWRRCAEVFLANLAPFGEDDRVSTDTSDAPTDAGAVPKTGLDAANTLAAYHRWRDFREAAS